MPRSVLEGLACPEPRACVRRSLIITITGVLTSSPVRLGSGGLRVQRSRGCVPKVHILDLKPGSWPAKKETLEGTQGGSCAGLEPCAVNAEGGHEGSKIWEKEKGEHGQK